MKKKDNLSLQLSVEKTNKLEYSCFIHNRLKEKAEFYIDDRFRLETRDSSGKIINPTRTLARKVPYGTKIKTFFKMTLNGNEKREIKKVSFERSKKEYVLYWKRGLYSYWFENIKSGTYKIKLSSQYIDAKSITLGAGDEIEYPKEAINPIETKEIQIELK